MADTPTEAGPASLEIERKWLLPAATAVLGATGKSFVGLRIEQVYLEEEGDWRERVRRVRHPDGSERFFHTRKRRLSALVREEDEREITEAEYESLLERADPGFEPLRKTRTVFEHGGRTWELDLFDRYPGVAILEVELESEDDDVSPPGFLGPAVEVTTDERYESRALARKGASFPR